MPTTRESPRSASTIRLRQRLVWAPVESVRPGLAALLLALPAAADPAPAVPVPLVPGAAVERSLTAGEKAHFEVEAVPDAIGLLLVDQMGIDVVVEILAPGGRSLTVDTPQGREGVESALIVPGATPVGSLRIEIRNEERGVASGGFRLQLLPLSRETAEDRRSLQVEEAVTEAGRRYRQRTDAGAFQQAPALLHRALELHQRLPEPQREAQIWFLLGAFQEASENRREATEAYRRALDLWRRLDHLPGVSSALHHLGVVSLRAGDFPRALDLLQEALELRQHSPQRPLELETRNQLCLTLQRSGEFDQASRCYHLARELARELGDRPLLARLLNSLGGIHQNRGAPTAALKAFEEARELGHSLGDAFLEGATLNNLGALHRALGEVEDALLHYRAALSLFEKIDNRTWQARTLNNLGFAYLSLGEFERARATLQRALSLRRAVGDRAGEAVTLLNLGRASAGLGESVTALALFREALDLNQTRGNPRGITTARRLLGEVHLERREPDAARRMLDLALAALQQRGQKRQEGEVLELLARAAHAQDRKGRQAPTNLEEARALATRALALHRAVQDPLGEIRARTTLARIERDLGRRQVAAGELEGALATLETLQGRLGEPDRRAAFVASQRQVYETLVGLRMELHRRSPEKRYHHAALEAAERARSRALLSLLEGTGGERDWSGGDPALEQRLRDARRRFTARTQQRLKILDRRHTPQQARAAEQAAYEALRELEAVRAELRRSHPRSAAVQAAEPLDTAGIQALLDPDTVLLELLLGEEGSFLWWVTAETVAAFELPPRQVLEDLARRVRAQLSAPHQRTAADREALVALGRLLLGPVADRLGHQRLVIVADGALHTVPFAALPRPGSGEPLLLHHEVVHLPSASVLAAQRRGAAKTRSGSADLKRLAILADPIFDRDDPRNGNPPRTPGGMSEVPSATALRSGLEDLVRLPHTRLEAEAIAALVPKEQRLLALGSEARRSLVVEGTLAEYRLLHFATHGFLHPHAPELSGLVFSRLDAAGGELDGFLGLHDVAHLELSAALVVLSGCQTALGKEVRGEGLVGLTRGFLYAGVPRVVASLWQVRDQATAELMEQFYRGLLVDDLPPAAALRAAQLALRQERRFRDPFYWAAFTIQGDWR